MNKEVAGKLFDALVQAGAVSIRRCPFCGKRFTGATSNTSIYYCANCEVDFS